MIGTAAAVALSTAAMAVGEASAATLTLSENGKPLAPGAKLELFGEQNVSITSSLGQLNCEQPGEGTGVKFRVVSNGAATDELAEEGDFGQILNPCPGIAGRVTLGFGPSDGMIVRATGVATSLVPGLSAGFQGLVKIGPNGGRKVFPEVVCSYVKPAARGTNTASATRKPLEIQFSTNMPVAFHEPPEACPKRTHADVSLDLSRGEGGGPIEEQLG
jgi:hypothetical protein